jgi:hypothetical protein
LISFGVTPVVAALPDRVAAPAGVASTSNATTGRPTSHRRIWIPPCAGARMHITIRGRIVLAPAVFGADK